MTAQQIFYILGSVTFGVFILFLLGLGLFIYSLHRKITNLHNVAKFTANEIAGIFRDGKSYGKYLGASFGSSILGKLLSILR